MELTSKQRAQLRGMASTLDTIVHVGKDGIGENLIKQVNDALEARELIKGRVLENSMLTAREAGEQSRKSGTTFQITISNNHFGADMSVEAVAQTLADLLERKLAAGVIG